MRKALRWVLIAVVSPAAVVPRVTAVHAAAEIVRDVNASFAGSFLTPPTRLAQAGDIAFFAANDRLGTGLWRTDGTPAGTRRLAALDGNAHFVSVDAEIDGIAYLTIAFNHPRGDAVWRSDGTPAGTRPLGDEHPLAPRFAVEWDDATYYLDRSAPGQSYALWRAADGALEELGGAIGVPQSPPAVLEDALFFYSFDSQHGNELWRSDGTRRGTKLFRDIDRGPSGSMGPTGPQFERLGDRLCFFAQVDFVERLWCTDGTPSGTASVSPLYVSSPRELTAVGGLLLFTEGSGVDQELWRSDGTAEGTFSLGPIHSSRIELDGLIYFLRTPEGPPFNAPDAQLWRTDGTAAGTVELTRIRSDRSGYRCNDWQPTVLNDTLLLRVDSVVSDCELGVFDPSTARITRLYERPPAAMPLEADGLVALNARVAFVGTLNTSELWSSDGTPAGTVILRDGFMPTGDSDPRPFLAVDGGVLFVAHTDTTGRQVWFSDGTRAGTVRITDFTRFMTQHPLLAPLGGGAVMATSDEPHTLSFLPGSGPLPMPVELDGEGYGGMSLFSTGTHVYFDIGRGLSLTDGTAAGTQRLAPTVPADFSFGAAHVGDLVFFTNNEDRQLWRSDGTAAGTHAVWTPEGDAQSHPEEVTGAGPLAYFRARTVAEGEELWISDGTEAGTQLAADIRPTTAGGDRNSRPRNLTALGDQLLFDADDGVHGRELWRSNGTATEMVTDLAPGADSAIEFDPAPTGLLPFAHEALLYFKAVVPQPGALWRSDGTAAGTIMLKATSSAMNFIGIEDSVFFLDRGCGDEDRIGLWRSAGTPERTQCVLRLENPVTFLAEPADVFAVSNGRLYFPATDGWVGVEPWSVPTAALLCRGDEDDSRTVSIDELIRGVGAALGTSPPPANLDADGDDRIAISELITAVRNATDGCTNSAGPD